MDITVGQIHHVQMQYVASVRTSTLVPMNCQLCPAEGAVFPMGILSMPASHHWLSTMHAVPQRQL